MNMTPTAEHLKLNQAYDFFNKKLFGGELPDCMITMQRKNQTAGYFWAEQFKSRDADAPQFTDEIAMNPEVFALQGDKDILSTLVHEMCHLWQQHFGKPSRTGYHNKEWARKMNQVGLKPISYDRPGSETGQKVGDEVIEGGAFDTAYAELVTTHNFKMQWQAQGKGRYIKGGGSNNGDVSLTDALTGEETLQEQKRKSKTKYTCSCNTNIWGKPGLSVICGQCGTAFIEQE